MTLKVFRNQHNVGQGSFHDATFKIKGTQVYKYIYDLGGDNKLVADALERSFKESKKLDLLVISSFDKDHFCGVLLLKKIGIIPGRVILPHAINESFLKAFILNDLILSKGVFDDDLLQRIRSIALLYQYSQNLAKGFEDVTRNFSTVVDKDAGDWMIDFFSYEVDLDLYNKIWASMEESCTGLCEKLGVLREHIDDEDADYNDFLWVVTDIYKELKEEISVNGKMVTIKERLDSIFAETSLRDYNSASLCMYSGPVESAAKKFVMKNTTKVRKVYYGGCNILSPLVGWIAFGDYNFSPKEKTYLNFDRINAWILKYKNRVGVCLLPHHGAYSSFSEEVALNRFLNCFEEGVVYISSSNPFNARYRHPSSAIVFRCEEIGFFVSVTKEYNYADMVI